jgi:hypothetical protein
MNELDHLIERIHKGKRVDAQAVFDAAGLPDEFDTSVHMIAQGTYFDENLDLDRSLLVPGDDPGDYLIPQAEFFNAAGSQRTLEIMNGAELAPEELVVFRASRGASLLSDWGGWTVCIYEFIGARQIAYGAFRATGGGYEYRDLHGPVFATLGLADAWARTLPNFYGWFPYGGATVETMIAAARNPDAFPIKKS